MSHDEVMRITEKLSNFLSNEIAAMTRDERIFTPRDMENAVYQGIRAAYEAGEIAMREKAAKTVEAKFESAPAGIGNAGPLVRGAVLKEKP